MGEENIDVQSGAAMCLARMVDAGAGPLITSFTSFFPRINKLLTSSKFFAIGSLSPVVTRLSQHLPKVKWGEPKPAKAEWIKSFLKMHEVDEAIIEAVLSQTPYSRIDRKMCAPNNEIFLQWDVQETKPEEDAVTETWDWKLAAGIVRNQLDHDNCPDDAEYSCVSQRRDRCPSQLDKIPKELEVIESNDLKDLYRMLRTQPVTANVHFFSPELDDIGSGIYVGCSCNGSEYMGLRSIIVVAITRERNKLVAVVKSSHGTTNGVFRYMFVSLTRMLVGVGYRGTKGIRGIRGLRKLVKVKSPSYLLRDFTYLEMPLKSESEKSKRKKRKVMDCK
ncbi:uncharacterized protein LOC111829730 [Capsella rubella]|uniref:uncharacterized protein LOC111829730 n=1 Tax=Capsella rubella TaxID=81985 RepID=UPI000CD57140|nr:uncharacterized protein LOC111829730 [Capsella rubella]